MANKDSHIKEYEFKGLRGRYGYWGARSKSAKRTFVLIYGQHANIERLKPLVDIFTRYGDVYVPDNPGFGGMESSYKIGEKPTLAFYGDHLNNFLTNYVPTDRLLTIVGISFGFQVAAECLYRHPSLQPDVEHIVSLMGFVKPSDFIMSPTYKVPLVYMLAWPGKSWLGSELFKRIATEKTVVATYMATKPIQVKLKSLSRNDAKKYAKEQARLWIDNDPRTHASTGWDFINKNDISSYKLPVNAIHLGVPKDHIINSASVRSSMKKMFKHLLSYDLHIENHAPLDVEDENDIEKFIPPGLAIVLSESKNKKAAT